MNRRIGIEVFYWLDQWSDDQTAVFDRVAAAGFDGAEISFVAGHDLAVQDVASGAAAAGIDVLCSTGLTEDLDITSTDPGIRAAGRAHLERCLRDAAELGSPILGGVTYAPWMSLGGDVEDRRRRSADVLHHVADEAQRVGVTLCLEVLNRFESSMFNTVEECLAFIDLIGHPSVGVEIDTFHMNMEEDDLARAVSLAGDRLGHVQVAANNRRPPQFGHIDWPPFRAALDSAGYDGWVVFETFPNPDVETGRSTRAWRSLVTNLDLEARDAATFMRRYIA
jgi:D-psicose/D-tagatose/L-ribulose 3-epimerase